MDDNRFTQRPGGVRLLLDSHWQLPELSILTARYTDLYAFYYSLRRLDDDTADRRASETFVAYPWHVGYSSLNFFRDLYFAVEPRDRLAVVEIRYASPGFIELVQDPRVIGAISTAILTLGAGLNRAS